MRIICTVNELVSIARGCSDFRRNNYCLKCLMYETCKESDGFVEKFVSASDVIEQEDTNETD